MADSDDDGEEFESADENLSGSESEEEKNDPPSTSSETTKYRKRPERTVASGPKKINIREKKEAAKPDLFLQDVASHITKNFDGILKTSSLIKDVVFGGSAILETQEKEKPNLFDEPEIFDDDEVQTSETVKEIEALEQVQQEIKTLQVEKEESVDIVDVLANEKSEWDDEIEWGDEENVEWAPLKADEVKAVQKVESEEIIKPETKWEPESIPKLQSEPELKSEPIPEPKSIAVSEPEENLESTEGWDDFDFDEDESVVTKSTETSSEAKGDSKIFQGDSKPRQAEKSWGLSGWGVGSLLDTATAVTRGLSNVLETGLGVPDPETLAAASKSDRVVREKSTEDVADVPAFPDFGITSLVAGVTSKIVEKTKVQEIGSKVISGGLDTLENIGKKTMQVLQEGDPGLKKKRALLLGNDKPVLSRILREAKEKAENEDKILEEKKAERNCRFETLFDDFQGLVHLEALEMLSRQCEIKLEQLKASSSEEEKQDLEGILEEVKQLCDIQESDFEPSSEVSRFKSVLTEAVKPLKNEVSPLKIIQIHEQAEEWLRQSETERTNRKVIYQKAMSTVAELTAATAHQFHKAGELLLIKERRKTVEEAEALMQLTNLLCLEVDVMSNKFLHRLKKEEDDGSLNLDVENVLRESENAISYIKQAFNLLVPVLQLGAT